MLPLQCHRTKVVYMIFQFFEACRSRLGAAGSACLVTRATEPGVVDTILGNVLIHVTENALGDGDSHAKKSKSQCALCLHKNLLHYFLKTCPFLLALHLEFPC